MDSIPQYNPTGCKIPFWIAANSGNYQCAGDPHPTIHGARGGRLLRKVDLLMGIVQSHEVSRRAPNEPGEHFSGVLNEE